MHRTIRSTLSLSLLFAGHALLSGNAMANIVGTDAQNFNTTTSGLDFISVQSARTLSPGEANFGLFYNYSVNTFPAVLGRSGGVPTQSASEINDTLHAMDLSFGYGLMENWDIGLSLPFIINQSVDDTTNLGRFENKGVTEYRFNTKYRFVNEADWGLAGISSVNINQIKNNPFVGEDGGPIFNFELALDKRIQQMLFAFNIGYRLRNPGEKIVSTEIDPIPNQFIFSAAMDYDFTDSTTLTLEVLGAVPTEDVESATNREISAYEFLGGIRQDFNQEFAGYFGGGLELINGTATPDWRIFAGLTWRFGNSEKKNSKFRIAKNSSKKKKRVKKRRRRYSEISFEDEESDSILGE